MEKKSTKTAYLVAVVVIIALLAFLGTSYANKPIIVEDAETPFAGTFWSLLPPICAIALALISKEVYSSLFFGCLIGALLYTQFRPWETILALVGSDYGLLSVLCDSWNMGIIIFLVELGIISDLMNKGGGSEAFGRWAKTRVKSRASAQLITMLLGVLIFVDDYFNCLTVGAVMRPVTESHNISRAKLAYVIDATAAPVCMIAPISSWAAAVSGYVNSDNVNGFQLFIKQIPWNYYCILTLVMIVVISIKNIDYGPMLQHEYNAQVKGDLFTTEHRPFEGADDYEAPSDKKTSVADLLVPVIVLIVFCIIGMIYTGGFFEGTSFIESFANSDASIGLVLGSFCAMVLTMFFYMFRKSLDFSSIMECIPEGFKQMVPAILILTFAWSLKAMTDSLGAKEFVAYIIQNKAAGFAGLLPFIIFLIAVGLSFATGTSWGTFGILIPIVVACFQTTDYQLMIISMSACMAGAVCGDHCSPISDTTIMSSAGAQCNHLNHVSTQIPYAMTCAVISALTYIVAGLTKNVFLPLLAGLVILIAVMYILSRRAARESA